MVYLHTVCFTYVYHTDQLNVDKYTIYGFYGIWTFQSSKESEGRKTIKIRPHKTHCAQKTTDLAKFFVGAKPWEITGYSLAMFCVFGGH